MPRLDGRQSSRLVGTPPPLRSIDLQVALVRLIRSWIGIIADQPAFVRGLLLVLFLASTSLYLLGIASLVAASRIAALPTETPLVRTVEQTVVVLATEAAQEATPEPTDTPTTIVPAVLLRPTSTPSGPATITPTLEATPTQARNVPRIAPPPEPSVAPARAPVLLSPVTTPGPVGTGTRLANGTGVAFATVPPGLRPLTGTPGPRASGTPDEDVPTLPPTATVRLGQPAPVGPTPPSGASPSSAPTSLPPSTQPTPGPGLPPGAQPSPTPAPFLPAATSTPAPPVGLKPGSLPPPPTVRR